MSDTIYKGKDHNPLDFILHEGKVKRNNTMKIKNEIYYFSRVFLLPLSFSGLMVVYLTKSTSWGVFNVFINLQLHIIFYFVVSEMKLRASNTIHKFSATNLCHPVPCPLGCNLLFLLLLFVYIYYCTSCKRLFMPDKAILAFLLKNGHTYTHKGRLKSKGW